MSWVLAIDFGTVATAAATIELDGPLGVRPISVEVKGSWRIPSCVLRLEDGTLLVGVDAERRAGMRIEAFEPTPKRRMGDQSMDLGGRVRVSEAIAALLRMAAEEARRTRGGSQPDAVCLTHPALWAGPRIAALREAADLAGMPDAVLLSEPVAAAVWYAATSGRVEKGERVAVYDLGGGTFDAAIIESNGDGTFATVGQPRGIDWLGGVDFDHALLGLVMKTIAARDPQLWTALDKPATTAARRQRQTLIEQVRILKEELSFAAQSSLLVPETEMEVAVTREQFASLIRIDVERSATVLEETIAAAGMAPAELAAVYLVGGSSRIPVVEEILARRLGVTPATLDEPKQVVAFGAVLDVARRVPDLMTARAAAELADQEESGQERTGQEGAGQEAERTEPARAIAEGTRAQAESAGRDGPPAPPESSVVPAPPPPPPKRPWWTKPPAVLAGVVAGAAVFAGIAAVVASGKGPSKGSGPGPSVTCADGTVVYSYSSCSSSSSSASGDPSSSGPTSTSPNAVLSTAEQALVNRVSTRLINPTSCLGYPKYEDSYSLAAVNCSPAAGANTATAPAVAPATLWLFQDKTASALQSDLDNVFGTASTLKSDCVTPPATHTWKYSKDQDSVVRGSFYCKVNSGGDATFAWSYTDYNIWIEAVGNGGLPDGLRQWWTTSDASVAPA